MSRVRKNTCLLSCAVVHSDQAWVHQPSHFWGGHIVPGEELHKEAPPFLVGGGDEKRRGEAVVQTVDEARDHGVPCEEDFVPSPSQQFASPPKRGREKAMISISVKHWPLDNPPTHLPVPAAVHKQVAGCEAAAALPLEGCAG